MSQDQSTIVLGFAAQLNWPLPIDCGSCVELDPDSSLIVLEHRRLFLLPYPSPPSLPIINIYILSWISTSTQITRP